MIAFVLGTRPELIKTAPVIHELARRKSPFALIHTGQHYTPALDEVFFKDLENPVFTRFQVLEVWVFGDLLDVPRDVETIQVALVTDLPVDEVIPVADTVLVRPDPD